MDGGTLLKYLEGAANQVGREQFKAHFAAQQRLDAAPPARQFVLDDQHQQVGADVLFGPVHQLDRPQPLVGQHLEITQPKKKLDQIKINIDTND